MLGATGVEDKLQDGVGQTLAALSEAGIGVWVLTGEKHHLTCFQLLATGDKKETALNISYSCGHFTQDMTVLDLCGQTAMRVGGKLQTYTDLTSHREEQWALVVDGFSLTNILPHQENRELLHHVAIQCQAVVCCRMSPLQKAEIVKLMKSSPLGLVTAAIGDGGNDVSMIQEAHVGIGIFGREGRAAARAADFAFAKFKFLQKVILVHGHWYYYRVSMLVQYFFYKNVAVFTDQLVYAFYTSFSIQTLFDGANLTLYNLLFTALPIFVFALLAQNKEASRLLSQPHLYRLISGNSLLSSRELFLWFLHGVWHSTAVYFGWLLCWTRTVNNSSFGDQMMGQSSFGLCIYTTLVLLVSLKLAFHSRSLNWPLIASILASIGLYLAFNFIFHSLWISTSLLNLVGWSYNSEAIDKAPIDWEMVRVFYHIISSPPFWLFTILILVFALIPDILVRVLRKHWMSIKRKSQVLMMLPFIKLVQLCR